MWEVRSGKEWVALPAHKVERARLAKELLARARRLEREARAGGATRRTAYCGWLLDEGLHVEALAELDRVLRAEPDQADALALLARASLPELRLPELEQAGEEELDGFFAEASRYGPSARELAVARLREAPEIPGLLDRLQAELVSKDARRRALATLVLQRMFPGRHLQALLSRAVLDVSSEVREGASRALRTAEDPVVILPVVRALGSTSPRVRSNAVQALGTMNYAAAVEPLITHLTTTLQYGGGARAPHAHVMVGRQMAYIQDFDVEVSQGESIADPVVNVLQEGAVLDAAVLGVTELQVQTERAEVRRSLGRLTGASPGNSTGAWKRWWEEHGDEWNARTRRPGPVSSPESPTR
jgi:hypothetical protein